MVNPFSVACFVCHSQSGCRCPPWPVWWRSAKPCCRLFTYFATDLTLGFLLARAAVKISEGFPFPTLILVLFLCLVQLPGCLISSPPNEIPRTASNTDRQANKQANHDDRLKQNPHLFRRFGWQELRQNHVFFSYSLLLFSVSFTSHSTFFLHTSDLRPRAQFRTDTFAAIRVATPPTGLSLFI